MDTSGSGIFVWIGSQCTKNEKVQAMNTASKFLSEKGYPSWTKVYHLANTLSIILTDELTLFKVNRVVDGGEPTMFKQYFASWKEKSTSAVPIPLPVVVKGDQLAG